MAVTSRLLSATGVVLAGLVVAAAVGQLPAVGLERHVIVATPPSAGQHLVCPGGAIAAGAAGQKASTLSASAGPARRIGTSGTVHASSHALGRGNVRGETGTAPRLVTAPAASGRTGAIAGAQAQVVADGDAAGLAATACTVPVNTAWLAAGSTTTGRTTVLTLANASRVPAQVALRIWTEHGLVQGAGGDLLVAPHSRKAVSLASLAPAAAGTALEVLSTGGQLGVALEQRTVRGLESGGLDITGPTAAPATEQVITGVRISGAAAVAAAAAAEGYADLAPVVRVLAPGAAGTNVQVHVTGAAGAAGARTITKHIEPGVVTDLPLAGLGDGVYTVRVTGAVPIVAGARVSVVGDPSASTTDTATTAATDVPAPATQTAGAPAGDRGLLGGADSAPTSDSTGGDAATTVVDPSATTSTARGIDLAWIAAAEPLGASAAVAVAAGPSAVLALANPGRRAVTARFDGQAITVPAGGTASASTGSGVHRLTGVDGLRAAVSYAGADAVAAYPVAPADQAAHAVRVTH
ncbi:MAG: hypothetical protein QOE37_813 [Microbacteriaceae bacterium]|nr:hypothetical protein [Microbacteriaceae bacterium]